MEKVLSFRFKKAVTCWEPRRPGISRSKEGEPIWIIFPLGDTDARHSGLWGSTK